MDIYLDNAATSHPKPPEVIAAVVGALTDSNGNPGRSGHTRSLAGGRLLVSCRDELAGFLGVDDPECITFCFNCTDALNLGIKGVLSRGAHVICSSLEHNSVLRVLDSLSSSGQIEWTIVRPEADGVVNPDSIFAAIKDNTRLIVLTHASNVTGAIQPVAAVGLEARRLGIPYLIDGAQAVGSAVVDIPALNCDMYAFPGHKGLLGPQGTGGLYIRRGLTLATLREGGTGSVSDSIAQPTERPERYESGTANLPGFAGLSAGVKFVGERREAIRSNEIVLTDMLIEELRRIDGVVLYTGDRAGGRVGVVSFNVGDYTSSETADYLDSAGIAVRGGLHCAPLAHRALGTFERGAVRASVGWSTGESDIEALLGALRDMIAGK